jgi:hypothetical protein
MSSTESMPSTICIASSPDVTSHNCAHKRQRPAHVSHISARSHTDFAKRLTQG